MSWASGKPRAKGLLQCPALAAGVYHIRIEAVGFLNAERIGVKIPSLGSVKIQLRAGQSERIADPEGRSEDSLEPLLSSAILTADLPLVATVQAPPTKRNFLARLFSGIKHKLQ
jgi:hypothetical protein